MVLSHAADEQFTPSSSPVTPAHLVFPRQWSHSTPLPAFHYSDTDDHYTYMAGDSSGDGVDSEIDDAPTFHYESDCDDTQQIEDDEELVEYAGRQRTALTISTAASLSHSSSVATPHAAYVSPSSFFASPSFASLLSTRAASLAVSSPTSCTSHSSAFTSSSPNSSSSLPSYSPHSSCVQPRVFAWKLEEAAVLFWERKSVLLTADKQSVKGSSGGEARFVHHSRHSSL